MPKIKDTQISHLDDYTIVQKFKHKKVHKITKSGKEELKNANRTIKKRARRIGKELINLKLDNDE